MLTKFCLKSLLFIERYLTVLVCFRVDLSAGKWKTSIPGLELCSGPFKLVVTVPETCQSGEKGVELTVWGTDDNRHWGHVTKHHLGEELHISMSEVLYAADSQRSKNMVNKGTYTERLGKHCKRAEKQESKTIIH